MQAAITGLIARAAARAPGQHDVPHRESEGTEVERDEDPGRVVDALQQGDHLATLELGP
jgi:hypothetical protein